jgi:transcriptional regulator with XRE-family HTH domain
MGDEPLDRYERWSLQPPTLPAHSRLYRLPPIGVGTAQVECLTSYTTRLAAAHAVSVRCLVVQELIPHLGRPHLGGAVNNSLSAFWQRDSPALNGMGALASDWVGVLELMTQWPGLDRLTMLPWAEAVPTHGLLRRTRAWCAACYAEWQQHGQIIYEPLQWLLTAVAVCAWHHQPLAVRCPRAGCQRHQPPLGSRAEAGHCAFCGSWLGAESVPAGVVDVDDGWAYWVAQAVGAVLAVGGIGPAPQRADVVGRIASCIDEHGGSGRCARVLGLSLSTIWQWRRGMHLPHLGLLVHLCKGLDTTPVHVLTGTGVALATSTGGPPPRVPPTRRSRCSAFPTAVIEQRLEQALRAQAWPPPSMRQVARQLGYTHTDLLHRFPTLCRAISARYLTYRTTVGEQKMRQLSAEVRQATHTVHTQGLYPSSSRVAQLLSKPSHFRHPLANAAWHEALHELGWEP